MRRRRRVDFDSLGSLLPWRRVYSFSSSLFLPLKKENKKMGLLSVLQQEYQVYVDEFGEFPTDDFAYF